MLLVYTYGQTVDLIHQLPAEAGEPHSSGPSTIRMQQAFPDAGALRTPRSLDDLLLYRMARAVRAGSGMATRLVEGGFGITRREW